MVRSQRSHTFTCPAIAVTGGELIAVENAGNQVIRGDSDQQPNRCDDVLRCGIALAAPTPRQAQFGMNAPRPMNQEGDLASLSIEIGKLARDRVMRPMQ